MTEPVVYTTRAKFGHEPVRRSGRISLVALVLVLIAIVKPWGPTDAERTAPSPPQAAPPAPPMEVVRIGDDPCTGRSWVIQVHKRWVDQTVRSWIMTDAVEASGPTDGRIRFVTVTSTEVLSVGYCQARADEIEPPARLTIYRLGPTVQLVTAVAVTVPEPALGSERALFRPASADRSPAPSGPPAAPASWESGRYVLRVDGSNGFPRWLGLEIRIVDAAPPG
jgi:hypothetical protein